MSEDEYRIHDTLGQLLKLQMTACDMKDQYMRGLTNGIIFCMSCIDGCPPIYVNPDGVRV